MKARAEIEDAGKGYQRIVVTEIPYMVNKARMVEAAAELVKDKRITGIRDIRDESDRHGMRVVFELKRDENAGCDIESIAQIHSAPNFFWDSVAVRGSGPPQANESQRNLRSIHRIPKRSRYKADQI